MSATMAVQLDSVAEELKVWVLKLGADAAEDDWIAVDSRSRTGPADGRSARGEMRACRRWAVGRGRSTAAAACYTSAAATQFAHLNRGLADPPATLAGHPAYTRPSAGHIRAGPNLSLAGPNLSLAGRLAGRAAGPILGVASPDFPSGRPGGRPDLAAGRPVRQGGRPLTT